MSTVCLGEETFICRVFVTIWKVFSPNSCTAPWLQCWIKSQAASDSACFCSHFLLHKQTAIVLFKHMLGNKALWKWPEPGAEASQGVKSTVTARILRFVILPVTALKGVHIPKGMKLWERLVLNAKTNSGRASPWWGDLGLGSRAWQSPAAMQPQDSPWHPGLCCLSPGEGCRASLQRGAREKNRQKGEGKAEGN